MDSEDRYVTVGEAARLGGYSVDTIRRWVDNGQVEAKRSAGGHRRVRLSSLLNMESRAERGAAPALSAVKGDPLEAVAALVALTDDWHVWSPTRRTSTEAMESAFADLALLTGRLADVRSAISNEMTEREDLARLRSGD